MKRPAAGLLCLLALLAAPAGAQVRKWVDAQGHVHYGDRAPIGQEVAETPLRGTVSVAAGMTVVPDFFKRPARPPTKTAAPMPAAGEVWMYTTPTCGYCRHAKEHLRLKGIPFVEKDIQASADHHEEFRALGGRGVPLTLAGGSRYGGYREDPFEQFLKAAGF